MDTYIQDAENIWTDFNYRYQNDTKFRQLSPINQLEFYQKNHSQFMMSFPIVLRYMIEMKSYNTKAFKKFIERLYKKPYKTELEYCERQADYVKYLYMECSKSHNMKDAQELWRQTYESLEREVNAFKRAEEQVKNRLDSANSQNSQERREELIKLLNQIPE